MRVEARPSRVVVFRYGETEVGTSISIVTVKSPDLNGCVEVEEYGLSQVKLLVIVVEIGSVALLVLVVGEVAALV
jgi:hypothetical protein